MKYATPAEAWATELDFVLIALAALGPWALPGAAICGVVIGVIRLFAR